MGKHHLSMTLKDAFKVARAVEDDAFQAIGYEEASAGERRLLWHGSRTANFGSILSQGIRWVPGVGLNPPLGQRRTVDAGRSPARTPSILSMQDRGQSRGTELPGGRHAVNLGCGENPGLVGGRLKSGTRALWRYDALAHCRPDGPRFFVATTQRRVRRLLARASQDPVPPPSCLSTRVKLVLMLPNPKPLLLCKANPNPPQLRNVPRARHFLQSTSFHRPTLSSQGETNALVLSSLAGSISGTGAPMRALVAILAKVRPPLAEAPPVKDPSRALPATANHPRPNTILLPAAKKP